MILIFTNKEDVHPNPVIEKLHEWDVPIFRLNTEALLTDYQFCWWADANGCDFYIRCNQNGLEVWGSKITSIWDRRPLIPSELPLKNNDQINKHNLIEACGFLSFIRYYLKDIPSIGNIVNDRVASSKMLQYKIAKEVGFVIPETCFSNHKTFFTTLAKKHNSLLLKPIENSDVWDDESDLDYVFYAQKVPSDNVLEVPDEAFSQTVTFAQNYVEKDFELRVTIVDNNVFSCKIDSQLQGDNQGKIDWRQGYEYGLKHSIFDLPEEISEKCKMFLHKIGLRFGCFDFIVNKKGEYVFLECNPNGQWLWVELETGLKISNAIAEALTNKHFQTL